MIVDDMHHNHPELLKDMHWNESVPITLPYTEETQHYRKEEPKGSAEQREEEDHNYQVGATTLSRITFRITTHRIVLLSIATILSIVTLSVMTLNKATFSIVKFSIITPRLMRTIDAYAKHHYAWCHH